MSNRTLITKVIIPYSLCILTALLLAKVLTKTVIFKAQVVGESMEPTYYNDDQLLVSPIPKLNYNDIITFKYEDKILIKRLVALPGDTVYIENSHLYVNGVQQSEDYLPQNLEYQALNLSTPITLSSDEYIALGDNRNNSMDSRYFGVIKKNQILGKKIKDLKTTK